MKNLVPGMIEDKFGIFYKIIPQHLIMRLKKNSRLLVKKLRFGKE